MSRSTAPGTPKRALWIRLLVALTATVAVASVTLSLGVTVWAKALHGGAQVVTVTFNSMTPVFAARDVLAVRPPHRVGRSGGRRHHHDEAAHRRPGHPPDHPDHRRRWRQLGAVIRPPLGPVLLRRPR